MECHDHPGPLWRALGATVRGANHIRLGLPNQDAWGSEPDDRNGPVVAVAVADGHGSQRSPRSDAGARIAVQVALEVAGEFLMGGLQDVTPSEVKREAEERLPRLIESRWKQRVDEHVAAHPITGGSPDGKPYLVYGSTVLLTIAAPSYMIFAQLGDGDILLVSEGGEVRRPLEADSRLFANETTSLARDHAWRDFRVAYHRVDAHMPSATGLVLLATDGYANSFVDDLGFLKVGADLLAFLSDDGPEAVHAVLGGWLREASDSGSGDDVTVVLMFDATQLKRVETTPQISSLPPVVIDEPASNQELQRDADEREPLEHDESPAMNAPDASGFHQWPLAESDVDLRASASSQPSRGGRRLEAEAECRGMHVEPNASDESV